jgi:hypothetical protein
MGYAILWLGILAGFLLLDAFLIAVASHSGKRFVRVGLPGLIGIPYLPIAAAALLTGWMYFENVGPRWTFWYALSLPIAGFIGFIVIDRKGMKRSSIKEEPKERSWLQKIMGFLRPKREAQVPAWPRLKLSGAFLIVSIITVVTYLYMDNSALEEIARFRTETTTQLQQMMPPRSPDAQNARLVYEQAFKSLGVGKDLPKWLDHTPADVSRQELADFVGKNKKTLDLVYKGAALPNLSHDVDMAKPAYEWPIPQFSDYRSIARLLYHSACLKADAGDAVGALKDLAVIETMSNHLRTVPSLIWVIAVGIDNIRVQGFEHLLSRLPDRSLKHASPVKAHTTALDTIYRAMRFEFVVISQGFYFSAANDFGKKMYTGGEEETSPQWALSLYRIFFLAGDMKAEQAQNSIMAKPVRTYEELNRNNMEANQAAKSTGGTLKTLLAGYPEYTSYIHLTMAYEARQGLADLALAMTAYKAAKGRYPEKLDELVPDHIDRIPKDPFDGKPLKMKPVKGGLELYSTASHPEIKPSGGMQNPINFYLGKEAYEEFRVKPEREKRLKAEHMKSQPPEARKGDEGAKKSEVSK